MKFIRFASHSDRKLERKVQAATPTVAASFQGTAIHRTSTLLRIAWGDGRAALRWLYLHPRAAAPPTQPPRNRGFHTAPGPVRLALVTTPPA
jgi:hypothetical protein